MTSLRRLAICLVLSIIALPVNLYAKDVSYTNEQAIRAVLGESRGEGYKGMYAVACAIRNRGTLKGVYGLRAKMESISEELYQTACKAWYTSEYGVDVTHGSNSWENVNTFGVPYWTKGLKPTAVIGHHTFYEVKQ